MKKLLYQNKHSFIEHDQTNRELLALASMTDATDYDSDNLLKAKLLLEQLPKYWDSHFRILPLLHRKAKKLNLLGALSPDIHSHLKIKTKNALVRQLAIRQQLSLLIELFSQNEIPIILLKGSALNGSVYSLDVPRDSTDIDILVRHSDWSKAVELVSDIMYYQQKDNPDVFGDIYELSFRPKSCTGGVLDLHKSLTHPILFNICEQELWQASLVHPVFANPLVRMLSAEQALVHQALHAYKDMNFCKYNLVDTHEIICQLKVDLTLAVKIAKKWGALVALKKLLNNCRYVMHTPIPAGVDKELQLSPIQQVLTTRLLSSKFARPVNQKKSVLYRLNQCCAQFVFCSSLIRPIKLQLLFIKHYLQRGYVQ
ncbi:nucleotidyltransferase family protein [Catenovulum agarivorans]|uniref:nucleotidyltransferase family protein n=1 Tax=Catenovulum agarivorans TaxID=1172192 RepID=UPI00030C4CC2|nr:nucleotidyltransferase family protein [Catenovulum agarivorans]